MYRLAIGVISIFIGVTSAVAAGGVGPSEWAQYRLNPSHNAVYQDGGRAIPSQHFKTGDQVRATPVVVGDHLYIGNHATGGMFAFNVRTGNKLWDDDNPWFRHAPNWIHSEMLYVHDRIFVGYGNRAFKSATVRGTGQSGVMAVDPKTGKTLWDHPTVGEVMPTPAYWHGTLYAVTGGGQLIALNPETGKSQWRLALPGWVSMSSPAVKDGVLYVGALNSVVAVDLIEHKTRWVYRDNASFTDVPPAVSNHNIVVITGMKAPHALSPEEKKRYARVKGDLQFIYAFNAKTGKLLWKHLMGSGAAQANNTSGAPAIANGRVYVGSPYTYSMFAYDLKSGRKLWDDPIGAKIKGAPAIADGRVYFGDTAGFLHVLDANNGDQIARADGGAVGKLKLGGSLNASRDVALAPAGPVVINQNVFVGSQDGFVYCVSIPKWLGLQ